MTNEKILEVKKALQQTEIKSLAHKRVLEKIDDELNILDKQIEGYENGLYTFTNDEFIYELQEQKKIYANIMQKLAIKVLDYGVVKKKLEAVLNNDNQN